MCGTIIFVNLPQNGCICNRYIHQESAALPNASPTGVRERNGEFNPSRLQIARYPLHRLFQSEAACAYKRIRCAITVKIITDQRALTHSSS
jgi:hypothetical protein